MTTVCPLSLLLTTKTIGLDLSLIHIMIYRQASEIKTNVNEHLPTNVSNKEKVAHPVLRQVKIDNITKLERMTIVLS